MSISYHWDVGFISLKALCWRPTVERLKVPLPLRGHMVENPARRTLDETEIYSLVYDYIGVEGGYLKEFTYRLHNEFYPRFCGFTVDVPGVRARIGTTKEAFIAILRDAESEHQARIVEGVFAFLPLERFPASERAFKAAARNTLLNAVARIRGQGVAVDDLGQASESVRRALRDAAVLIEENGNVSGVDRVHTALHGYLRALCASNGVSFNQDADAVKLLRMLRDQVPALKPTGARHAEIVKIQNALATILDALGPIRNQASMAHPNDNLLDVAEAALTIDATRTLLNYLNRKLGTRAAARE